MNELMNIDMKKIFLVLIGAMMMCASYAQVVEQGEAALVYYSPKTSVTLNFTYTVEVFEPGIYSQFAEALLGTKNAVTETRTEYTLTNVRIGTRTSTDYTRPHKVTVEPGIPLLLRIDEKGLLTGYNVPPVDDAVDNTSNKRNEKKDRNKGNEPLTVPPFPEEVLQAATPLAQANAVAKQIMHLRETRMYLLNGEVEHAPADGESMRLVLAELDKQEQALTELFTGKKSKRTEHKQVHFSPEKAEQLWFFSEENGFTDAENIDADTIRVTVALHKQTLVTPAEEPKKKKAPALSQIVYNLPGSADVKVDYQGRSLANRTIAVAQAGVDVPLAKEVFTGKELPVIVFSPKTGNIVSISK